MLLLNGDCIEEMQKLINDGVQVDSVVTDPPYHLTSIVKRFGKENSAPAQFGTDGAYARASKGFMGKEWDGGDIAFRPETWELALKLLKPGGHLLAFSASRNYHRMAVAIEDAGFEIRDQMMWLYGSGFPKSLNIGKAIDKKQGNEREVVGTRISAFGDADSSETSDGRNLWGKESTKEVNLTKGNSEYEGWGTALKPAHEPIVMARKPLSESSIVDNVLKHGTGGINIDDCRIGNEKITHRGMSSLGVMHDDDWKPKDIEVTSSGRFPANVMHDGLQTEWARFFYCPKTSKSERHSNLDDHETSVGANGNKWTDQDYRKGDTKPTTERKNTHPTVKPVDLMRYLCRMVTPKGGTVLDPFMGSGSTGMAAKDEGFDFIGIEKEKEYFEICESRINRFAPLMDFM